MKLPITGVLRRQLLNESAYVTFTSIAGVAVSALATLLVSLLCGPETRGFMAVGTVWLVISQQLALRSANVVVPRVLLAPSSSDENRATALHLRTRVTRDAPILATCTFAMLALFGRIPWIPAVLFGSASVSLATVNWNTWLLQTKPSLRSFATYRLVATTIPQFAQLILIALGVRSISGMAAGFLVGSLLANACGRAIAKVDKNPVPFPSAKAQKSATLAPQRERFYLTFHGILRAAAPRLDLIFLTLVASSAAIGQYSLAASIPAACDAVSWGFAVASFRRGVAATPWSGTDLKATIAVLITGVAAALTSYALLIPLVGAEYEAARFPAAILCIASIPNGVTWMISERWRGAGESAKSLGIELFGSAVLGLLLLTVGRSADLATVAKLVLVSKLASMSVAGGLLATRHFWPRQFESFQRQ